MATMLLAVSLSLLIGVSLGLLGGGGSILTVPILIYALGVEEKSAIASSLLVVGATSAVAAIQHARRGNVVWRVALWFAGAGMVGAFLGGKLAKLLPATVLLVLFALIMFGTALAMWRGRKNAPARAAPVQLPIGKIVIEGIVVGVVTGLVGAGGGFLVVPALALLGGLPMPHAVGSSLVVIALKSFAGFAGYVSHVSVDYRLTALVTVAAIAGSFVGGALGKKVDQEHLRKAFAVFVFTMAIFLLFKQAQAMWRAPEEKAPAPTPATAVEPAAVSAAGEVSPSVRAASSTARVASWTVDASRVPAGPAGDAIRRGKALAERTKELVPGHVGNALNCTSCHLGAGTTPGAAAWVGVTDRYPQYRARSGKVDSIEERINDCFERSMNGRALAADDPAMKDLVAWMTFLSADVDGKLVESDARIRPVALARAPDAERGRAIFAARCAACHGPEGTGLTSTPTASPFPPVAGPASFNVGAGMARLTTAAGFIRRNMPLGQGDTLTEEEAYDVAAWVTTQPRPDFLAKAQDWPRGGKPADARY